MNTWVVLFPPGFTRIKRLLPRCITALTLGFLVLFGSGCVNYFTVARSTTPATPLDEQDITGTWVSHYNELGPWPVSAWLEEDRLIIREDGTFKQIYRDAWQYFYRYEIPWNEWWVESRHFYRYETPWNEWWIEPREDGEAWLHLQGGRYYVGGAKWGEQEGLVCYNDDCTRSSPRVFLDPVSDGLTRMVGELILVIREDARGNMILVHMCTSQDGCEYDYFSRIRN